ncbi:unnamed protein product, partial [Ixodes pacificus]
MQQHGCPGRPQHGGQRERVLLAVEGRAGEAAPLAVALHAGLEQGAQLGVELGQAGQLVPDQLPHPLDAVPPVEVEPLRIQQQAAAAPKEQVPRACHLRCDPRRYSACKASPIGLFRDCRKN